MRFSDKTARPRTVPPVPPARLGCGRRPRDSAALEELHCKVALPHATVQFYDMQWLAVMRRRGVGFREL